MVCTVVKTACISLQDHPKHFVVHCNSMNSAAFQQFKARKHDSQLDCDSPSAADMRTLIITEQTFSPTSLRLAAANSPRPAAASFLFRRTSNSGRRSLWDVFSCEGQLPFKLLLLLGFCLCFSFILAICTLDASVRLNEDKSGPVQERRLLLGFHLENPQKAINERIEHLHQFASPSLHSLVGDRKQASTTAQNHEAALHGLGTVFSKGTKSMPNLIIANLEESLDILEFRLFLRTLYRSGSMARADLVLLFPGSSLSQEVARVLEEEETSFKKLLKSVTPSSNASNASTSDVNALQEFSDDAKSSAEKKRFIMWGDNNLFSNNEESQYDYGSVVGFFMNDLDPADSLSEFLVNPPSQLRRWVCYQMLLGLLRYRFRQVMLVDLGGVVILDDVFSQGRKRDFLYLSLEDSSWADALTEDSSQQQSSRAEERQGPLAEHIQDEEQVGASNEQDDPNVHIQPSGHSQVEMIKGVDVKHHAVHEPVLNKKGTVAARMKKARKIHPDSKGMAMKRKKQEIVNKSARLHGSRDNKVKKATQEEKRHVSQKSDEAYMGKATNNDSAKPKAEAETLRQEGYAVRKMIMMKMVYGKEVWENLEQAERQRKVVSSRVILGSMRSAKRLANSMAVEIVRVAMQRNSKRVFPDHALLSYLVQKSSHLLGKRLTDSLQVVGNGESMVHSLDNSKQGDVFVRSHDGQKYAIVQGSSLIFRPIRSMQTLPKDQSLMSNLALSHLIRADICASSADSAVFYDDCASL